MKVYLNEIVLHFQKVSPKSFPQFDLIVRDMDKFDPKLLVGNILVNSQNQALIHEILQVLHANRPKNLHSITFDWEDKDEVKKFLKRRYNFIKAAGGLVMKEGKFLLIYRLKKWDLPKGKMEKGEDVLDCALREVEEECGVQVVAGPKIGSTWHCYPTKSGWCLKKSTWYLMACTNDSEMKPQIEEDIEQIVWVDPRSLDKYMANSYGTIQDVFRKAAKKELI